MEENATELYRKYRPGLWKHVLGQPEAIKILDEMVKSNRVPHALLISGPSGCGKTTLARILKKKLNCSDIDFNEINAAEARGIDSIREIQQRMSISPLGGDCRMWLMDESHSLVNLAQQCLLKTLEDTPSHVYFILCTTDPQKLLKTILTRCTEIKLDLLSPSTLKELIQSVLKKEQKELSEEVVGQIAEVAEGSARKALVILNQIIGLTTEDEQLEAIRKSDSKRQAIEIARKLINPKTKWSEVAPILKEVEEEPESIRRMILGYARSVLLGGGGLSQRANDLINRFEGNFYDGGSSSLASACYDMVSKK